MKLLVFSDSHGRLEPMRSIIRMHMEDTDAVLHLGDGAAEVLTLRSAFPTIPFYAVQGNCDDASYTAYDIPYDRFLNLGGKMLFLCHGDRFGVTQSSHGALLAFAKHKRADIALFGHAHVVCEAYYPADDNKPGDKSVHIFSPGSISVPRDGAPSFGILDITEKGILFSPGRVNPTTGANA